MALEVTDPNTGKPRRIPQKEYRQEVGNPTTTYAVCPKCSARLEYDSIDAKLIDGIIKTYEASGMDKCPKCGERVSMTGSSGVIGSLIGEEPTAYSIASRRVTIGRRKFSLPFFKQKEPIGFKKEELERLGKQKP